MKRCIQERSHLHVPSVISISTKLWFEEAWKGTPHRREAICLLQVDFSPYPWKNTLVRKAIIANNVTRNLANLFPRKSKKPYYCKQCGKNFSYLLFLEKRYAIFCHIICNDGFSLQSFLSSSWKYPHRREVICLFQEWQDFKKGLIWMSMKGPTQERNHLPTW